MNASTNAAPTLVAVPMSPSGGSSASGTQVQIQGGRFLADGTFLIVFQTVANATYFVQYTEDFSTWNTVAQPVTGNGTYKLWIDYGPPATPSMPNAAKARFYRVIRVP